MYVFCSERFLGIFLDIKEVCIFIVRVSVIYVLLKFKIVFNIGELNKSEDKYYWNRI